MKDSKLCAQLCQLGTRCVEHLGRVWCSEKAQKIRDRVIAEMQESNASMSLSTIPAPVTANAGPDVGTLLIVLLGAFFLGIVSTMGVRWLVGCYRTKMSDNYICGIELAQLEDDKTLP